MSKANEWAAMMRDADRARDEVLCAAPHPFYFKLEPGRSITVEVGPDGRPMLNAPLVARERVEVEQLLALARWIIATFGEPE